MVLCGCGESVGGWEVWVCVCGYGVENVGMCLYVTTIKEKEALNLRESMGRAWEELGEEREGEII